MEYLFLKISKYTSCLLSLMILLRVKHENNTSSLIVSNKSYAVSCNPLTVYMKVTIFRHTFLNIICSESHAISLCQTAPSFLLSFTATLSYPSSKIFQCFDSTVPVTSKMIIAINNNNEIPCPLPFQGSASHYNFSYAIDWNWVAATFVYRTSISWCIVIWECGLWEAMRFRYGHEGVAQIMRLVLV